ncbi:MAG: Hsp20/alpha crystallin family protein [Nitrospiraceae bacterium]|nr:MAG: Hsp20/alpha crystallin family protein [Nitrospiraceae bacterium]
MLIRELERLENFLEPWRDFERLNRELFGTFSPVRTEFPPVNVRKNEEKAVVTAELPGVDPESVDISVAERKLTLRFERKPEELKEGESFTRKERWHGEFSRTIELPFNIQAEKVEARFSRGILDIELPRAEAEKPRKITVKPE